MKKILLLLALISSAASHSQTYGFETSEGYTVGDLPQGAWGPTSVATIRTISSTYASVGTQSLKIKGNNGTVHTAAGAISATNNVTADVVVVSFDVYFETPTDPNNGSDFYFSPQSPSESTIVSRLGFTYDKYIITLDADPETGNLGYVDTGATFNYDTWYSFKIEQDFASQLVNYYMNGNLIYTGPIVGGTKVGNIAITNDNYDSSAYFDNIKIYDPSNLSINASSISKLSVYPNPAKDLLNVSNTDAAINGIEISDLNGRIVKTMKISGLNDVQVNISDLSQGVYMMKIDSDKGTVTKKVIKE